MKRKRLEAWATWTEKFGWAFALSKPTPRTIETFTTHGRVVRLIEVGPDEVVVPKSAAAVVRAAVRWAQAGDVCPEECMRLVEAVEAMKGRRR